MGSDCAEQGYPTDLTSCLIGSCTNSSYEDITRAADVARQAAAHGAEAQTQLWCSPGSEQIHQTIKRDGQMADLEAIGAAVLANACGPCIGQWRRDDIEKGVPNSILTSFNRNFPKRNDGNPDTLAFIAQPRDLRRLRTRRDPRVRSRSPTSSKPPTARREVPARRRRPPRPRSPGTRAS